MARGLQKIEAQQKAQAKAKKAEGGKSNLKSRDAAMKAQCQYCKLPLADYANLKTHHEAKHSKLPLPTMESLGLTK